MKKLMIAASAALCAAVGFCDVTSANVVGYTTREVAADTYVMVGCPFEATGGGELHINDFIKGGDANLYPDFQEDYFAEIQVQKESGSGYDYYWLEWDGEDEDDPYFFWNGFDGEADFMVEPGFCCWFKNPHVCTITVAGQVADTDKDSITIAAGAYTMVANPFPVAVELNSDKVICSGLSANLYPDFQEEYFAELQIQKASGSGYDYYWLEWDGEDEDEPYFFWNGFDGEADVTIQPMTGFWLKDPKGGTIKFAL